MFSNLHRYARLTVRLALQLGAGDRLILLGPSVAAPLMDACKNAALEVGATAEPTIIDTGEIYERYAADEDDDFSGFSASVLSALANSEPACTKLLLVHSPQINMMERLPPETFRRYASLWNKTVDRLLAAAVQAGISCGLCYYPNAWWAKSLFPELTPEEAVHRLWDRLSKAHHLEQQDYEMRNAAALAEAAVRGNALVRRGYHGMKIIRERTAPEDMDASFCLAAEQPDAGMLLAFPCCKLVLTAVQQKTAAILIDLRTSRSPHQIGQPLFDDVLTVQHHPPEDGCILRQLKVTEVPDSSRPMEQLSILGQYANGKSEMILYKGIWQL